MKCWGEDSEIVRYEIGQYEKAFGAYIPMRDKHGKNFVKDMNKLLKWAGIKAKTLEELR